MKAEIELDEELAELIRERQMGFSPSRCIEHLENVREELNKLGEEFPGEIKVTLDYEFEGPYKEFLD